MLTLSKGATEGGRRVELRPEYVLGVPQSGRTARGGVPAPPVAGVTTAENLACDVARAVSQSSDADGLEATARPGWAFEVRDLCGVFSWLQLLAYMSRQRERGERIFSSERTKRRHARKRE